MRFEENIFITLSETEIFQILYNDYLQLQNFNVEFSKYCLNEDLNFAWWQTHFVSVVHTSFYALVHFLRSWQSLKL